MRQPDAKKVKDSLLAVPLKVLNSQKVKQNKYATNMSVSYLSNTSNSQEVDTFQKKQSVTEVPCGFGLVLLHCNLGTKVDVSITII